MVQKQFRKIKDWDEWLKIWENNEIEEVAIGLLHISPKELKLKEELEKIRFYLKVAWMYEYPRNPSERIVGNKAYQILLHNLLSGKRLEKRWGYVEPRAEVEAATWSEIINFFAYSKRDFSTDQEPYRSEAKMFVIRLQLSLGEDYGPFSFSREMREILSQEKEDLVRALINVEAFNHILSKNIFEAIPVLMEKITHWCWDYSPGEVEMGQRFLEGKKEWMRELEDPKSRAFRLALDRVLPKEIARTLMELIIKRDIPLLAKV